MCSVLQRVALCFENFCSVLLPFEIVVSEVSCNTMQHTKQLNFENRLVEMCSVLQCVAANLLRARAQNVLVEMCSVLQRVAAKFREWLQCVANFPNCCVEK